MALKRQAVRGSAPNMPKSAGKTEAIKNFIAKQKNPTSMYAKNGQGTPTYPGQQMGMTPAEAKLLYGCEVRSKGFTFSGGTTQNKQIIDIPGDARFLLGLASANGAWGSVSFKLNAFEAVEDTDTTFTKIGDNKEYYRLDLALTGRDSLQLIITGYAAYTNQPFIFFFI